MPHAIIRGVNGRRHEVDFEDAEIRIEVHSSDETVEIFVEAVNNLTPSDRHRLRSSTYQSVFSRRRPPRRRRGRERRDRDEHSRRRAKTPRLRLVCNTAVSAFALGL
jgi:hypothetical protein